MKSRRFARRLAIEIAGWGLVVAGIAALALPGPGLLGLFAGLLILSQQYDWAERRVEPVKVRAYKSATDSVQTWPRIFLSCAFVVALAAVGVLWLVGPEAPSWWPLRDSWWLLGGWGTGATMVASAAIALATIIYSFRHFRESTDSGGEAEDAAHADD